MGITPYNAITHSHNNAMTKSRTNSVFCHNFFRHRHAVVALLVSMLMFACLPNLTFAQINLEGGGNWTFNNDNNITRSMVCGTTYTFTATASGGAKDRNCVISSTTGCPITITLTTNNLRGNSDQNNDHIYIHDGNTTDAEQLADWTRNTGTNTSITSSGGVITIRFDHNRNTTRSFTVTIRQECCTLLGGGGNWTFNNNNNTTRTMDCGTDYTFSATSPGDTRDRYCVINSSRPDCPITITLTNNLLRGNSDQNNDHIYIYDGNGNGATQLADWTRNTPTSTSVSTTGGVVTIRFDHNRNTPRSFTVSIHQDCCFQCESPSTSYTIGTGTDEDYGLGPVDNYYYFSYREIVYDKDQLCNGTISGIAFQYASTNPMTIKNDAYIFVTETDLDDINESTTYFLGSSTLVYQGPLNCHNGWNWFEFNQAYNYSGERNLVIIIYDNSGSAYAHPENFQFNVSQSPDGLYKQYFEYSDDYTEIYPETVGSGYITTYYPNTKFCINCCNLDATIQITNP